MVSIFRIENPKSGRGFWTNYNDNDKRSCWEYSFYNEMCDFHYGMPNPYTDDINGFNSNYFCAFKTFEDLIYWVKPLWIEELVKIGFRVYKIQVSDYLVGNHQICYKKEDIIDKEDITFKVIN